MISGCTLGTFFMAFPPRRARSLDYSGNRPNLYMGARWSGSWPWFHKPPPLTVRRRGGTIS